MATEGPLAIEAPKQDIVNESEHAVVPVATPGPVIPSNEPNNTITQEPAGTSTFKPQSDRQEIPQGFQRPKASPAAPPSNAVFAAGEQQVQRENVQTNIEAQAVGDNAVRVKATRQHTQEIKREQTAYIEDDKGNIQMIKRTVTERRIYTDIQEVLLIDVNRNIKHSKKKAITSSEEDFEANATCGEKTIDLCCQSVSCHFKNPFKKNATAVEKNQLMNATRRRGRAKGWTILKGLLFPFVSDIARDIWVTFQLLFALVLFCLSTSTFALADRNFKIFHAVHLGLSVLAAFLAIVDCIISFTQCSTCKACVSYCRKKAGKEDSVDINEIASSHKLKRCRRCYVVLRSGLDVVRLLLTEYILVPIIFCDMFEVATGKGFNSDVTYHRIGFTLMVYDSIGLIVFVFLLRLVILGRMIRAEQRAHPTQEDVDINKLYSCKEYNVDWSIKKNSRKIQVVFFLHVFGQTLAHALMLVAVGAKIAWDNRNFSSDVDQPFVSGYLWYMMVAAYIIPTLGIGTYFIVNNYWVQQFLIGLCIDFVKVLQIIEDNKPFSASKDEKPSEAICKFVRMSKLETEYKEMRKVNFCDKVAYPFKSPGLVVVCLFYAGCQIAFVLCSVFTIDNNQAGFNIVFLNDGGWIAYVFVAAIAGAIINVYAFLVAGIWIMIIVMVIAAVALLIAGCVCLVIAAGSSNN